MTATCQNGVPLLPRPLATAEGQLLRGQALPKRRLEPGRWQPRDICAHADAGFARRAQMSGGWWQPGFLPARLLSSHDEFVEHLEASSRSPSRRVRVVETGDPDRWWRAPRNRRERKGPGLPARATDVHREQVARIRRLRPPSPAISHHTSVRAACGCGRRPVMVRRGEQTNGSWAATCCRCGGYVNPLSVAHRGTGSA